MSADYELLIQRIEAMRAANKEMMAAIQNPELAAWHDGVDVTYGLVLDLIKIMKKGGGE